jgi:hypothetical protein
MVRLNVPARSVRKPFGTDGIVGLLAFNPYDAAKPPMTQPIARTTP